MKQLERRQTTAARRETPIPRCLSSLSDSRGKFAAAESAVGRRMIVKVKLRMVVTVAELAGFNTRVYRIVVDLSPSVCVRACPLMHLAYIP